MKSHSTTVKIVKVSGRVRWTSEMNSRAQHFGDLRFFEFSFGSVFEMERKAAIADQHLQTTWPLAVNNGRHVVLQQRELAGCFVVCTRFWCHGACDTAISGNLWSHEIQPMNLNLKYFGIFIPSIMPLRISPYTPRNDFATPTASICWPGARKVLKSLGYISNL